MAIRCSSINSEMDYQFEDFVLKQSLWSFFEEKLDSISEKNIIKKAIGQSIVDETLDLNKEVANLHDIWREYHEQVHNITCEQVLPEPPLMRENLEKQITLLVELLQQRIARQGGKPVETMLTENERDMIKNIAGSNNDSRSRSSSLSGRRTPSSGYNSRCSDYSVNLDEMQDSINIVEVDHIIQPLREEFESERKSLLADIDYIQAALIHENEQQLIKQSNPSPTLTDLRQLSSKLEKEVLQDGSEKTISPVVRKKTSTPEKLRPLKTKVAAVPLHLPSDRSQKGIPPNSGDQSRIGVGRTLSDPSRAGVVITSKTLTYSINNNDILSNSIGRKKLTPSPPTNERTSYKPSSIHASKFRKHVANTSKEVTS